MGARGLVIASTVAVVVQAVLLQRRLGVAIHGLGFGGLWSPLGKIILGTLAMVAVVEAGWYLVREIYGAEVIAVVGLIPLGAAVYAASLWGLKVEGRDELAVVWGKIRGKLA